MNHNSNEIYFKEEKQLHTEWMCSIRKPINQVLLKSLANKSQYKDFIQILIPTNILQNNFLENQNNMCIAQTVKILRNFWRVYGYVAIIIFLNVVIIQVQILKYLRKRRQICDSHQNDSGDRMWLGVEMQQCLLYIGFR